jgi:monovalent cation/proton antiporter MnhG/PhaG subunit
VLEVVGVILLFGGLLLATIGLYGMLRHPAILDQLHAAGLVTGPAIVLVLAASIAVGEAETVTSAVLVILFVLITSPLSGHAIAQAARRREVRRAESERPDA